MRLEPTIVSGHSTDTLTRSSRFRVVTFLPQYTLPVNIKTRIKFDGKFVTAYMRHKTNKRCVYLRSWHLSGKSWYLALSELMLSVSELFCAIGTVHVSGTSESAVTYPVTSRQSTSSPDTRGGILIKSATEKTTQWVGGLKTGAQNMWRLFLARLTAIHTARLSTQCAHFMRTWLHKWQ